MSIYRILHFSDVHAGLVDFHLGYLFDKRFFGRLNQFCRRQRNLALENIDKVAALLKEKKIDFTVCTGDLTSIGSAEEFAHVTKLLQPILDYAGDNFLFVPGNHDAYVRQSAGALRDAFNTLNRNQLDFDALPGSIVRGEVEFIALNPARPCRIWQSTGEMKQDAWARLDYILSSPAAPGVKARLLVSHFPIVDHGNKPLCWRTKFIDAAAHLEDAVKHRVFSAMLTGHVHHPFIYPLGTAGCLAVGAGSLTIQNSCSLVSVDTETGLSTAEILHF
jgi:3',5'-cyclic AMP phosphodiesterase CpdA